MSLCRHQDWCTPSHPFRHFVLVFNRRSPLCCWGLHCSMVAPGHAQGHRCTAFSRLLLVSLALCFVAAAEPAARNITLSGVWGRDGITVSWHRVGVHGTMKARAYAHVAGNACSYFCPRGMTQPCA